MTTDKQVLATRRNGGQSVGPRTQQEKRRSRQAAFRHGLTAETVIDKAENAEDYAEFEQAIIDDYQPITAIEYQLVMRLASLLWRLRRTVAIESGLFQLQGHLIRNLCVSPSQIDRLKFSVSCLIPRHSSRIAIPLTIRICRPAADFKRHRRTLN
jgi:hypothetical protein